MSRQLLTIARRARDDGLLLEAYYARGADSFWRGRPAAAQRWLDGAIALYDPSRHFALAVTYAAQDPGVASFALRGWARWFLGDADGALDDVGAAVALAGRLGHPFSLAFARLFEAWIHKLRRETDAASEAAEAVIELATQQEFPFWATTAALVRGAARAEGESVEDGIAEMRQALSALEAIGTGVARTCYLGWLAEAEARAGRLASAVDLVDDALATARRTGERIWEAELHRLKGGLARPRADAERGFRRALGVTRGQRALSLELRAATALGRLWRDRGEGPRARRLLAATCARFPAGLDTADLRDARSIGSTGEGRAG